MPCLPNSICSFASYLLYSTEQMLIIERATETCTAEIPTHSEGASVVIAEYVS